MPDQGLAKALGIWRSWLAEHDAGLVPIADPDRFQWAGWWIATLRHEVGDPATTGSTEVAVLAFGSPPGIVLSTLDPALLGRAVASLAPAAEALDCRGFTPGTD